MRDHQMGGNRCFDDLIQSIATYDRRQCVEQLEAITRPPLDFTRDFLEMQSLDRLRHIVMAALIQSRRGRGARNATWRGHEPDGCDGGTLTRGDERNL